jgi:hypothetical protein
MAKPITPRDSSRVPPESAGNTAPVDRIVDVGCVSREQAIAAVHESTPSEFLEGRMNVFDQEVYEGGQRAIAAIPAYPIRIPAAIAEAAVPSIGRAMNAVAEVVERFYGAEVEKTNDDHGASIRMKGTFTEGQGRLDIVSLPGDRQGVRETGDYSALGGMVDINTPHEYFLRYGEPTKRHLLEREEPPSSHSIVTRRVAHDSASAAPTKFHPVARNGQKNPRVDLRLWSSGPQREDSSRGLPERQVPPRRARPHEAPPRFYRYMGQLLTAAERDRVIAQNRARARADEARAVEVFNSLFANPIAPQITASLSGIELENELDRQLLLRFLEKVSRHGFVRPILSDGPGFYPQRALACAVDRFLEFEGNPIRGPAVPLGDKPTIAELNRFLITRLAALRAHLDGRIAEYALPDDSASDAPATAALLRQAIEHFIREVTDAEPSPLPESIASSDSPLAVVGRFRFRQLMRLFEVDFQGARLEAAEVSQPIGVDGRAHAEAPTSDQKSRLRSLFQRRGPKGATGMAASYGSRVNDGTLIKSDYLDVTSIRRGFAWLQRMQYSSPSSKFLRRGEPYRIPLATAERIADLLDSDGSNPSRNLEEASSILTAARCDAFAGKFDEPSPKHDVDPHWSTRVRPHVLETAWVNDFVWQQGAPVRDSLPSGDVGLRPTGNNYFLRRLGRIGDGEGEIRFVSFRLYLKDQNAALMFQANIGDDWEHRWAFDGRDSYRGDFRWPDRGQDLSLETGRWIDVELDLIDDLGAKPGQSLEGLAFSSNDGNVLYDDVRVSERPR